jgi:hypothetical protein
MQKTNLIVAIALLGTVAAGGALWLWERQRQAPAAESSAERLLIGFAPDRVRRVRIQVGKLTLDRRRHHGRWSPVPGRPDSGAAVRIDLILRRLATLRARPARGGGAKAPPRPGRASPSEAVAAIDVWRGRARPLRLRFYQRGRRVLLHTSDRPGRYAVDAGILRLLRREVRQAGQAPALPVSPDRIASVSVKRDGRETTLVRRGGRWFVEDGGALAPAEPAAVGRLLRELRGLRITHRLGQGAAVRREHGLDRPRVSFTVEDGKAHRLAVGGPCPKDDAARVAAVGGNLQRLVCVTPPATRAYAARFVSNQLFNLGPDEVKAVSMKWGTRTLALISRPAGSGWTLISPDERKVAPPAARALVDALARLRGKPVPAEQIMPPPGARAAGSLKLTPLRGASERIDLWATGGADRPRWARLAGGGRWLTLDATDAWLLTADPVVLRPRSICQAEPARIFALSRAGLGGRTEVIRRDGADFRLVVLAGQIPHRKALDIASNLHEYQSTKRVERTQRGRRWTRPVLLVSEADRQLRATLFGRIARLRAVSFVSAAAQRAHGLGRRSLRLGYEYQHHCAVDDQGRRTCQTGRCEVVLGASAENGSCYGRKVGEQAVFRAPASLCRAARQPLLRRQVTEAPLHALHRIELQAGSADLTLVRQDSGRWRRPDGSRVAGARELGIPLLFLAPLRARRVIAYTSNSSETPVLSVRLQSPKTPEVRLRFYAADEKEASRYRVRRTDRPATYEVPAGPVQRLRDLVRPAGPR